MSQQNFDALYADESTRPIIHALIAAIGYVKGQSIQNAAVMTATLKVGIDALESLRIKYADAILANPDSRLEITCPDCGNVKVIPDVFEGDKPISGECPKCKEQLYFA